MMSSQVSVSSTKISQPNEYRLGQVEAQKLLGSIRIPPKPQIVQAIFSERAKDEPDVGRIACLIANDVGLSALVLKTVNSPYYGLRGKIGSIQQAVSMLGMKNIGTLVMGLALRTSMPVENMERYWESASRGAELAGLLARKLGLSIAEDAHLYTLFHDSAMPLLVQRFPDYRETMEEIANTPWDSVTNIEDTRHDTNHAVVGGLLVSNWGLPETIRMAITLHHDITVFSRSDVDRDVVTLIALGHVAEHVESALSQEMNDCECEAFGDQCVYHLMLGKEELRDFVDSAKDLYEIHDC